MPHRSRHRVPRHPRRAHRELYVRRLPLAHQPPSARPAHHSQSALHSSLHCTTPASRLPARTWTWTAVGASRGSPSAAKREPFTAAIGAISSAALHRERTAILDDNHSHQVGSSRHGEHLPCGRRSVQVDIQRATSSSMMLVATRTPCRPRGGGAGWRSFHESVLSGDPGRRARSVWGCATGAQHGHVRIARQPPIACSVVIGRTPPGHERAAAMTR